MPKLKHSIRTEVYLSHQAIKWIDDCIRSGLDGSSRSEVIRNIVNEKVRNELQKTHSS